jgi:uncharacterized membrane protein
MGKPNGRAPARLFHAAVFLKGLDGVIEVLGAFALWLVGPGRLINLIYRITQDRISKDSDDLFATHLRTAASHISLSGDHFMTAYLLVSGLIKIVVVFALVRGKLWAYPLAIAVFGLLVVYSLYRYTSTHGAGLLLLSAFDILLIWLVWKEYRAVKQSDASEKK